MSWHGVARRLCRGFDERRRAEMLGHLHDADAAGATIGASEAGSILFAVIAWQLTRLGRQVPTMLAGLPVLALCLACYGSVYESHFYPWDMMEDVPSTTTWVAALRRAVDLAWIVILPLGLYSGWRVAVRLKQGSLGLPGLYVASLFYLITQADLFIERTTWFAEPLQTRHVNEVSGYSIGLIVAVLALPIAFSVIDLLTSRGAVRSRSEPSIAPVEPGPASAVGPVEPRRVGPAAGRSEQHPSPTSEDQPSSDRSGPGVGTENGQTIALVAVVSPGLMFITGLLWVVPFLLCTWLTPVFGRGQKIGASLLAVAVPVAGLAQVLVAGADDIRTDLLFVVIAAQLVMWTWMTVTALRAWR